ncbi:DeoR/GlpR family DNA-binding transcription regulator [Gryllotalpicola protaetiae]|uniref:DeoR/GlpR transcriptional regulator n=1 Tax=Gryllotalpicola protaetiae TaxID=2419771 RepID=A0A387BUR0_9MICO|nr:DeoR/GlpR family DNA-binding transcription regulator [Gryllotalpicola protaetiae]AYG04719.1 DeoR/GlpR transcriptional regulator [Gryllotalpicola protaetiae]
MTRADARRTAIVARARARGSVRVTELAGMFDVSEMTVRRDIDLLVADGVLDRVYGGASIPGGPTRADEPGFETKLQREEQEKIAIAREALAMVRPGSAIGLSAGTTTWHLASALAERLDCTVITNSVRIASVLFPAATGGHGHVLLTGGERTPSDALVGPIATGSLGRLHLDVLFLGVHGMDPDFGFTTPNLLEAETNRAFIRAARRVAVLADHTKWGTVGMTTIADLGEPEVVITDDGMPAEARRELAEHVRELRIAPLG